MTEAHLIDTSVREYSTDPYDMFGREIKPGDVLVRPSQFQSDRLTLVKVREIRNGRIYTEGNSQPLKLPGRCMIANGALPIAGIKGTPGPGDIVTFKLR